MNFDELPLSTSAYLADTQHLSLPQHGAYLLILMTMWRAKGWLPDDDRMLANICKLSVSKWLKISAEIRALLIVRDGRLSQKRLLFEIENVMKTSLKNSANGKAGGLAKALKNKDQGVANATVSLDSRQNAPVTATLSSSSDSEFKKREGRKSGGASLSSDWLPTAADVEYGIALNLTRLEIDGFAEDMRLWARANANRAVGRKSDWTATFRGWMRREAARLKSKRGAHYDQRDGSLLDAINGLPGDDEGAGYQAGRKGSIQRLPAR